MTAAVTLQPLPAPHIATWRVLAGDNDAVLVGFVRVAGADWIARDRGTTTSAATVRRFTGREDALNWLVSRSRSARLAA